jgi:hypothetical protein
VGVAAETGIEPVHLFVDHRVIGHTGDEIVFLRLGRQLAIQQQIAGFQEVTMVGELFDRIPAVQQRALVTIDVGDFGFARCG